MTFILLLPPPRVPYALQVATEVLSEARLKLNPTKCEAWATDLSTLPASFPCIRAPTPTVMRLHAAPATVVDLPGASTASQVPGDHGSMQDLVTGRRAFLEALHKMRKSGLSLQATWALVKQKAASDAMWWARTVGLPSTTAQRLDADVSQFVRDTFDLEDLPPTLMRAFFLPCARVG